MFDLVYTFGTSIFEFIILYCFVKDNCYCKTTSSNVTKVDILQKYIYIVIKFNYTTTLYYKNLSLFLQPIVELLYLLTTSLRIGILGILCTPILDLINVFIYTSFNVTIFDFFFLLRVIFKLQRLIFIIIGSPRADNKTISGSLYGI